jgi:hypothetical protein
VEVIPDPGKAVLIGKHPKVIVGCRFDGLDKNPLGFFEDRLEAAHRRSLTGIRLIVGMCGLQALEIGTVVGQTGRLLFTPKEPL